MTMNAPSFKVPLGGVATDGRALEDALLRARELAHTIASLPGDAPESQHPSYGVLRALTLTIIDMLEQIAQDAESRPARSGTRLRQGYP